MNNQSILKFEESFLDTLKKSAENTLHAALSVGQKFESSDSFSYLLTSKNEKYVGKIYRFSHWPPPGKPEYIQKLLKSKDIEHEEIVYTTHKHPVFKFGWQLSKYIPGETVKHIKKNDSWDVDNYYVQLGKQLSKVHELKLEHFGSLIDSEEQFDSFEDYLKQELSKKDFSQLPSNYSKYLDVITKAKKMILENIDVFNVEQPTLIHDDVNERNVIWQNGKPILIDWVDSLASLPTREFSTITFRLDAPVLKYLEKGYGKPIDHKELRLHQMVRFINLGHFFYFEDDDIVEFEKMMQRLSRLLTMMEPYGA